MAMNRRGQPEAVRGLTEEEFDLLPEPSSPTLRSAEKKQSRLSGTFSDTKRPFDIEGDAADWEIELFKTSLPAGSSTPSDLDTLSPTTRIKRLRTDEPGSSDPFDDPAEKGLDQDSGKSSMPSARKLVSPLVPLLPIATINETAVDPRRRLMFDTEDDNPGGSRDKSLETLPPHPAINGAGPRGRQTKYAVSTYRSLPDPQKAKQGGNSARSGKDSLSSSGSRAKGKQTAASSKSKQSKSVESEDDGLDALPIQLIRKPSVLVPGLPAKRSVFAQPSKAALARAEQLRIAQEQFEEELKEANARSKIRVRLTLPDTPSESSEPPYPTVHTMDLDPYTEERSDSGKKDQISAKPTASILAQNPSPAKIRVEPLSPNVSNSMHIDPDYEEPVSSGKKRTSVKPTASSRLSSPAPVRIQPEPEYVDKLERRPPRPTKQTSSITTTTTTTNLKPKATVKSNRPGTFELGPMEMADMKVVKLNKDSMEMEVPFSPTLAGFSFLFTPELHANLLQQYQQQKARGHINQPPVWRISMKVSSAAEEESGDDSFDLNL
jgi:hypothetical protein